MSVIDFGGTNQQAGDGFTESGTKPIPAEGWGTFVIINSKTINGNLIYTAQNSRKEECGILVLPVKNSGRKIRQETHSER